MTPGPLRLAAALLAASGLAGAGSGTEVVSSGDEPGIRISRGSGAAASPEPSEAASPAAADHVEEGGAAVVVSGGRWRVVLGPELPLRGLGPCTGGPAPDPGGCARPVLLVHESGSPRLHAGTVPGCGEWRASSVGRGEHGRISLTLEARTPIPGGARRVALEVDLAPSGWDVLRPIPAFAACAGPSDCEWIHVLGFSPTGAFAYAVGPGTPNAPAAPSRLRVVHLVTDRVLLDAPYAPDAVQEGVARRYSVRESEPWSGWGSGGAFEVVLEGDAVILRRPDGLSKRIGKLPRGKGPARVLGCFQSPTEKRMAVVVATGGPGGIAVFGAHREAGFPGSPPPASQSLLDATPEAIGALVRAGADPNAGLVGAVASATDYGEGADLEVALARLRALLAAGADPNRPAPDGTTALGVAVTTRTLYWNAGPGPDSGDEQVAEGSIPPSEAKLRRRAVIAALLERGADPSLPTENGLSAAVRAYCDGDAEAVALLSKARRRFPRVTARSLLALRPKDHSTQVALDECALSHLEREGGRPEEIYAVATRPTVIASAGAGRALAVAAAHPAVAARARTDPALAEARKDVRARVALGMERLADPATMRRVLAAAGSLRISSCSSEDDRTWTFTEDGHVELSEHCEDEAKAQGVDEARGVPVCTTRGTYSVSGGAVVVAFPERPPERWQVTLSGLDVDVAGRSNAAPDCGSDP